MPSLTSTIEADLRANVDHTRRTGLGFWAWVVGKALVTPQVQVVVLHRLASALAHTPLRPSPTHSWKEGLLKWICEIVGGTPSSVYAAARDCPDAAGPATSATSATSDVHRFTSPPSEDPTL